MDAKAAIAWSSSAKFSTRLKPDLKRRFYDRIQEIQLPSVGKI